MTEALPFGRSLLARSLPAIALGGLLAAAPYADAATYYVAPTGSDAGSCSSTAPCRQIRRGLALAGPGDTVLVADGDYLGFDVRDRDGSAASPITIRAAGTNARVLKTTDRSDNRDTIFVTYSSYVVIDGLRSFSANRAAVRVDASQHITIRNGVFGANATWGIFTDFSDDLLIENNECYGSVSQHGIYVSNSGDRPVVRGNRVHDNRASGIQLNADATHGRRRAHHRRAHREERDLQQRRGRRGSDQPRRRPELDGPQQPALQQPRDRHRQLRVQRRGRPEGHGDREQHGLPGRGRPVGRDHLDGRPARTASATTSSTTRARPAAASTISPRPT